MRLVKKFEMLDAGLRTEWSDGATIVFPYRMLRLACRCAHCEDEITHERRLRAESVPEDIIAVDVLEIGRYGAQILWSDGHEAGIFPFEMLRELSEQAGLTDENK